MAKAETARVKELVWVTLALLAVRVRGILLGKMPELTMSVSVDVATPPLGGVTGLMLNEVVIPPNVGSP